MNPLKIVKRRVLNLNDQYLHGNLIQNGKLQLLLNRKPKFKHQKVASRTRGKTSHFYVGIDFPFLQVYEHKYWDNKGFGGRTTELEMIDGSTKAFEGTLWDPFDCPNEVPKYCGVSYTTDEEVWERGHTFYGGKMFRGFYCVTFRYAPTIKNEEKAAS